MATNPTNKKLAFELSVIGNAQTIKDIADVKAAIADLNKQIKEAQKNGDQVKFDSLNIEMEKLKKTSSILRQELKQQQKDFEISKYPTDSLKALESQYGKLTKSIRALSENERLSSFGQNAISKAKALKDEINEQSKAFGDTSKNIGNYERDIRRAFEHPLKFIKDLGLLGVLVTIGDAFFKMGEKALEAFAKTDEGKDKIERLNKGFDQMKAIGVSAFGAIITPILDLVQRHMPELIDLTAKVSAGFVATFKTFGAIRDNIKTFGSDSGLARESDSKLIKEIKSDIPALGLVIGSVQKGLDALKGKSKEVKEQYKDLGKVFSDSYEAEYTRLKNLKLPTEQKDEKQKKTNDENITALEELKRTEKEIEKIIEQKAATEKNYNEEVEDLVRLKIKIYQIEKQIEESIRKQQLAIQKENLSKIQAPKFDKSGSGDVVLDESILALENEKALEEQKKQDSKDEQQRQRDLDKLEKESFDAKLKALGIIRNEKEAQAERDRTVLNNYLQGFQTVYDTLFSFIYSQFDKEKDLVEKIKSDKTKSVEDEYTKKEAFAKGNGELIQKLEQDKQKKIDLINDEALKKEKQIATKRKLIAIQQAIINGALAAVQAISNTTLPFPLSLTALIPIGAIVAANIATIAATKFAKGGFTGEGLNIKDSTGQRVAGVVHQDEYVAPKHQVQRYPRLFQALNQDRTDKGSFVYRYSYDRGSMNKKYAEGGFTTPYLSQNLRNSLLGNNTSTTTAIIDEGSVLRIANVVYNAMSKGIEDHLPSALSSGLADANRRNEREINLKKKLAQ